MKGTNLPPSKAAAPLMLLQVLERISANAELSDTRKRDLRSAVVIYGKIVGAPLGEIRLELAAIRETLDSVVPLQAKVTRKRWANLRSDLAAAIGVSGVQLMLKTSDIKLTVPWQELLNATKDRESQMACRGSRAGQVRKACVQLTSTTRCWSASSRSLKRKALCAISAFSDATFPDCGTSWSLLFRTRDLAR